MTESKNNVDSMIRPFEWLTNAESLKSLISEHVLSSSEPSNSRKAMHVGSGSSVVGEFLVEELDFDLVVNADKDEDTMNQMEERWSMLTKGSGRFDRLIFCTIDFSENPFPYQDNFFDLVLDKSTLDCTLCSDNATASLLTEVYRCLNVGGVYILISFHEYELLFPLLSKLPGAKFEITHTTLERQVEDVARMTGSRSTALIESNSTPNPKPLNVIVARKKESGELNFDAVCRHVHATNDEWFMEYQPLLTRTRTESIKSAFVTPLNLTQAYQVMFTDAERDHLTYEHFLEDWQAFLEGKDQQEFPVEEKSKVSCKVALEFLQAMQ